MGEVVSGREGVYAAVLLFKPYRTQLGHLWGNTTKISHSMATYAETLPTSVTTHSLMPKHLQHQSQYVHLC